MASPMAAPSPASTRRQPLITLRVHDIAEELQQHKAAAPRAAAARSRAAPPEALVRAAAFCRFCWTCAAGAAASMVRQGHAPCVALITCTLHDLGIKPKLQGEGPRCTACCPALQLLTSCLRPLLAQGPPALAAAEALCVCLIYLLAVPNAVPSRTGRLHYTFPGSAEDVVALSLLRCVAVAAAHVLGGGPRFQRCVGVGMVCAGRAYLLGPLGAWAAAPRQAAPRLSTHPCCRPLLLTTAGLAAVSLPLGLLKLVALRHSQWPHRQWPPFVALYAAHMAFAVAHVLVAQVGRGRAPCTVLATDTARLLSPGSLPGCAAAVPWETSS